MSFLQMKDSILQELEEAFTEEKLEQFTREESQNMQNVLNEKWLSFSREMLNEVDMMNITIETENIKDVLWSAYRNIVPLLCMLHAVKETDCKRIRMMPSFNTMTRDINFLLQSIRSMKIVRLNQGVINIFGALMHRIESLNKDHLSWLLSYEDQISENSRLFLEKFVEMINSEMYHLHFYAPMEVEREKYLYNLYCETLKNNEKVNQLIQNLIELESNFEALQAEKVDCIETNRQFIQSVLDKHFDMRVRYRIEPEGKMVKMGQEFKGRKQLLLTQIQEKSAEYHTFLEKNLKSFQKIAEVKFKKEVNCQNWIQKYDTEAGERQMVLDDLHKQEEGLQEQIELYKKKSLEQEAAWHVYMEAKREDIRNELRIKVINRAATLIQKWWRKHWKRILKKRKKAKRKLAKKNKKMGKF